MAAEACVKCKDMIEALVMESGICPRCRTDRRAGFAYMNGDAGLRRQWGKRLDEINRGEARRFMGRFAAGNHRVKLSAK